MSFVHLHVHSSFSLLDGEGTVEKIVDKAKELGQTAIALTDHGVMYGLVDFFEYAKKQGIKPVLGCEVYTSARTRHDKVHEFDSQIGHLILLAKNNDGYQNLMNISSIGFTEGFYYRPRIDMEVLRSNSNGLIALSACMSGDVSRRLLNGNYEGAKQLALEYLDIFGKGNYFLEIQDHGIMEQKKLNLDLIRLSKELDIPLAATNDVHYVSQRDATFQDVLMCIQTGKTVQDQDRMKFSSDQLYLKSEEEMQALFPHAPESIENTSKIAEMCDVEIEFGKLHLPQFDLPEGYTSTQYLRELCHEGLRRRYPEKWEELMPNLEFELNIIEKMGYSDYFLIVWDFIKYAKDNQIMVGPGRGSAAGSIVSYCLSITNVDPVKYSLLFERFLNPERISMPDIDIDFCYERRQEVIDYVIRKYGEDRVCQIITFGTMAARAAIRDVGRALNVAYGTVDAVAKKIPFELGMTIEHALEVSHPLRADYENDPQVKELIDTAKELEGLPRHASTHAAGVVITREPVHKYVPLQTNDNVVTTQFPMGTIERLGLLKMDFLGLRTLTVIRDAVENVKRTSGEIIDIENIDFEDNNVYKMISAADTDGVFQLESSGMKQFMRELAPSSLEDIIAGISLYRPGPMDSIPRYVANKNDPSRVKYKHPKLEKILDVTYGCIVYQEQVMQIVRELGGYSLGRADLVRRAMSKKKTDVMEEEKKNFVYGIVDSDGNIEVDGAVRRGVDEKTAISIFDEMMDFAKYAFNKSHAAAYAVVAYQTAWLKFHYPTEFMAALLSSVLDRTSQVTKYILNCNKMGIKVLPPDINKSFNSFSVEEGSIRFGLGAAKNVGGAFVRKVAAERKKGGMFRSFNDFCSRMAELDINKRVVEALIRCGAFDSMGLKRSVLLHEYERTLSDAVNGKRSNLAGQMDLFGAISEESGYEDNFKDRDEFSSKELLTMEKEVVGLYLSGHPLDDYRTLIDRCSTASILEINESGSEQDNRKLTDGQPVSVAGIITQKRTKVTSKGGIMAFVMLEDLTGEMDVVVFPKTLRDYDSLITADSIVIMSGKLDLKEDEPPKLLCDRVETLNLENSVKSKLFIRLSTVDLQKIEEAKQIFKTFSGDVPVTFYYEDTKKQEGVPRHMWVNTNNSVLLELNRIFGAENVKLV